MEELMAAVVGIDFVLQALMDLPPEVLPGGGGPEAIREFLSASVRAEAKVVGEEACRSATALLAKVVDRMSDDVSAAAQLANDPGRRTC